MARVPICIPAFEQFCEDQDHWLSDYALFRALKQQFDGAYYLQWPAELVRRDPEPHWDRARRQFSNQVGEACFAQFLLFRQAERLKAHAHNHGLRLIGDLPFFVSPDSSDVWANPELFLLDAHLRPRFVAGVPPDYFSAQGQLWGNPVYNWDASSPGRAIAGGSIALPDPGRMWTRFASIIFVVSRRPGTCPRKRRRRKMESGSPGPALIFGKPSRRTWTACRLSPRTSELLRPRCMHCEINFISPACGFCSSPSTAVRTILIYPENYITNTVVYTGTHDNPTTRGWFDQLTSSQRESIWKYMRGKGAQERTRCHGRMMEVGWSSIAALAMAPLQDLLNLGDEARMNVPGRPEGNWRWRCAEEMLSDPGFEWLRDSHEGREPPKILCRQRSREAGSRINEVNASPGR